jgi:hypothetical protein
MVVSSFSCSGIPTGDLNPIYNVPMLGTHKARHPTTWAFLVFSEFLVIRHIIPSVMFAPAHVAGAL